MLIALDACPLGDLVSPRDNPYTRKVRSWMRSHIDVGDDFLLPEIADYEVRRNDILETLSDRIGPCESYKALYLLDQLKSEIEYLPLTTEAMRQAASLWANTQKGKSSVSPKLDGDAILAGQVIVRSNNTDRIVIATKNLRDFLVMHSLPPLVTAQEWDKI